MKPSSVDPLVASLTATAEREAALERVLHDKAGLRAIQDPMLVQERPGRAVFEARKGEIPVIIKWLTGGTAEDLARGMRDETAQVRRQFGGRFTLAKCLEARPGQGLLVFEKLSGTPLRQVLAGGADQRALAIEKAGVWHRAYTGKRHDLGEFGPWFWIETRAAVSRAHMSDDDRELYQAGLDAMKSMARDLAGVPLVQGAVHWDFAPQNFLWADEQVLGFDVGPTNHMSRSRAAAQFLSACALIPGGTRDADMRALIAGDASLQSESDSILPFFMIERLLERFLRRYETSDDRDALRAALQQAITS